MLRHSRGEQLPGRGNRRNAMPIRERKVARRTFLQLTAGAAFLPAASRFAWAQTYPSRPVRIMVGAPPGGAFDILARLTAQWLSERLGQAFVVENRPGAGHTIATEAVVRAPADGYTLLMVGTDHTTNATLYDKLNFNFIRDIAPVASITRQANVILVNPSFPAKALAEFVSYAKANPSKVNMASPGIGSVGHLTGELFKMMTGIEMVHVPYRGGAPAITDLLAGQVQVFFGGLPVSIEYIKAGRLRALAVTTSTRSEALPDIPTLGEFVTGYEASTVFGVGAPRNTPAEIIVKLNKEINAALADPGFKARLVDMGGTVLSCSPADYGRFIADETEKWGKVIRFANIKA
jgi:tripartite-type tricarboxylate transporter receptor subunit TctC